MKKSFLLFLFLLSGTAHATNDTTELKQQMKSFAGRVRVYFKCLRHCSPEEKKAAGETILKDGRNIFLVIAGLFIAKKYALPALAKKLQKRPKKTKQKEKQKEIEIKISLELQVAQAEFETVFEQEQKNNPNFLGFEIESELGGKIAISDRYKGAPGTIAYCIVPLDENNWIIVKAFYTSFEKAKAFLFNNMLPILRKTHGKQAMGYIDPENHKKRDKILQQEHPEYPKELPNMISHQ